MGRYILAPAAGQRQVTLIASGSEVEIALEAQALLARTDGIAAVVSMPCWELFAGAARPLPRRGPGARQLLRVAIEAAVPFGWDRWIGPDGGFVGMERLRRLRTPARTLYEHFKITPQAVVEKPSRPGSSVK